MTEPIIYRNRYFQQIEPYIGDRLIKVLTGQRRVGKSYLLRQISEEIKQRYPTTGIIYINKEDYTFDSIKTYIDLIEYINEKITNLTNVTLLIDEVQDINNFEKALRHFQQHEKRIDIYCTGSNATLLSGELATYLAGRYIQIKIHSLTYNEFLQFHSLTENQESFQKYIQSGGMPHLINLKDNREVYREYLNNVFNSIVLRDVIARYKIRNIQFLNDLIIFLADNTGSIVSSKRISDYLKSQNINLSPKLVLEYLKYLENVFFIERVRRAEVHGRKIFEIGDKFYFEDIGFRHVLVPFQQKDINKVLENIVFHHLKALQFEVYVGKMENKEIDFIALRNGKTFYIQVAYLIIDETTHQREFGNLLQIEDNHSKIVVSMDELSTDNYKGIEHWNIRIFLTKFGY